MAANIRVKICGLRSPEDVATAGRVGASYAGFVFFDRSPRNVTLDEARGLVASCPSGLLRVALTVDATDATLDAIVDAARPDWLQLHGKESCARVQDVRARYGLPVMKAVGVAEASDLAAIDDYARVVDQILIDAKAPKDAVLPGGNGLAFDWRLIAGRDWTVPWMLAGGLAPDNVAAAIRLTGARQVDVSSGVERAPGVKDAGLMRAFVAAAQDVG